jgi:hypothetical protein
MSVTSSVTAYSRFSVDFLRIEIDDSGYGSKSGSGVFLR